MSRARASPAADPGASAVDASAVPAAASWLARGLSAASDSIKRAAHHDQGGFARAAARFFIISRPFWVAPRHAPGFHYYADSTEGEESNGTQGPHFRHTKLNSPALIPRAAKADATAADGGVASAASAAAAGGGEIRAAEVTSVRVSAAARVHDFFHATPRRIAWSWSLLMVSLLVVCTWLHVQMSYCHRNMSTSLGARDAEKFYTTLSYYLITVMLASPLLSISQYAKSQLSMHWRIYLTNQMLQQYFAHRNYYYLQAGNSIGAGPSESPAAAANGKKASKADSSASASKSSKKSKKKTKGGSVDNPDQRIADDIRAFTRSSLTFVNELLDEVFQVVAFAGILFSISPMLVGGLIIYALLGTYLATAVFGIKLIQQNSKQSKLEADFRFGLVRVRTNAEAIAFYSGEHAELSYIYWQFSRIVRNLSRMAGVQCQLALFKHGYGFLTMLIPPFFLAPLYFEGTVELGVISQASMAFRQIFNSLNMVVSKMNELSKWRSGLERIWELECSLRAQDEAAARHIQQRRRSVTFESAEALRAAEESNVVSWSDAPAPASSAAAVSSHITVRQSAHLHLDHLMVCVQGDASDAATTATTNGSDEPAPRGERVLVQNLTLFLPSLQAQPMDPIAAALSPSSSGSTGRGLLVMGRSGIGKSTLLRAIAGLWQNGRGTIHRPNLSSLLFLPQRPYMILGTLRQQLLYPFCPETTTQPHTGIGRQSLASGGGGGEEDGSSSTSTSDLTSTTGLRRRWPSSVDSVGLASPSPPPPSSSDALLNFPMDASSGHPASVPSDADLEHILRLVNLAHLTRPQPRATGAASASAAAEGLDPSLSGLSTSGLDVLCDWSEVLSLGESQRVAFARILIHQPSYVFCDEITAALDAQNEEKLYAALSTYAPRTCLVSVGHRPALLKHHSHVLHLQEQGRWDLLEINEQNREAIDHITAVTTTT